MNWITGALKLVPLIVTAVQAVEKIGGAKTGQEKQDTAIDMVGQLIPVIEANIGRDVINETQVQSAIRNVINAVVSLMNVVRDVTDRHRSGGMTAVGN